MREALEAVKGGGMGAKRAARIYDVPPTTLKDRLSGRVKHGTKPGPAPYLSKKEEDELVKFLMKCSEVGCGKTRRETITIVLNTLKKKGENNL